MRLLLLTLAACTTPGVPDPAGGTGRSRDTAPPDSAAPEVEDTAPPDDTAPVDTGGEDSGGQDTGPADTGDPPPPPLAGPRGYLVAQDWNERDLPTSAGAGAGNYRIIVLQESMYTLLPDVRAANPGALVFAYQKAGGMRSDGGDHASVGVRTDEATESFYLHGTDGSRLTFCDYAGVWAADIGDPAFQALWLANVSARLVRDGFDGVMIDDVNTFPGHCLGERGGTPIAEYPTDEAYGEAVVDFIAAVGPGLQAAGLKVAPNIAMNPWEETMLDQSRAMLPHITHWVREYWMRWDDSANFTGGNFTATLDTMRAAQDAGVAYMALTYGPGAEGAAAGQRFGWASFLLAWDGSSDSAWGYKEANHDDPWAPDWGPDIGYPDGALVEDDGLYTRAYGRGFVAVNAGSRQRVLVPLDAPHRDAAGAEVTSVTLDPGEAAVLEKVRFE